MYSLAFSPCPNDTFIFDALVQGRTGSLKNLLDVHLEDVESLNRKAMRGVYDVTKLSFSAWLRVAGRYQILSAGGALGRGNGPLLVARPGIRARQLESSRIAIPGTLTTANLLLTLAYPDAKSRQEYLFSEIPEVLKRGDAEAGVLIHETRFLYRELGLELIQDLGSFWEELTRLPIPLGCIAVRRSLPLEVKQQFNVEIRESLLYAMDHPGASSDFIREHAQEMDESIIRAHVSTFVNEFSVALGEEGKMAVAALGNMALSRGWIDRLPEEPWVID